MRMTKRRTPHEAREQEALIEYARMALGPVGHLLIHIPNGGSRKNEIEGARLKRQGVRPGVSDLFLPVARGGWFGLWIEMKAAPPHDAPVTPAQREWIDEMRRQGYRAEVCRGVDEGIALLKEYLAMESTEGVSRDRLG